MTESTATTKQALDAVKAPRRSMYLRIALLIGAAIGLNLLVLQIPDPWINGLLDWGIGAYLVVFAITAIANASVIVPVPYPGVIAKITSLLGDPLGVAIMGAAGSTFGESTAFLVGRAGRGVVENTRFYRWLHQQFRSPWRAFAVILMLSAPPNPFFDIAGITAGSLGVPYWIFFVATLLGRIVKMLIFALLGHQLL
jgi:uncharacterized membrane protein YdjX (TVP38/TMEM64 family)